MRSALKKRSKELLHCFENQLGISDRTEKIWFWIVAALLLIYCEVVVFAHNFAFGSSGYAGFMCIIYALAVIPVCFMGIRLFSRLDAYEKGVRKNRTADRNSLYFTGGVFGITFLVFLLWQAAYWPGCYSPDSIVQFEQVITGEYNNWHPAIHTWLFMTVPYAIFHSPAAIVTYQIVLFSLSVAYLYYVLYTTGCSKLFMLLSWLYIVANPNNGQIMIYPWKDSAMSIFALVMFAQIIRIYDSEGAWLKKWYNVAAFSAAAFMTVSLRHNAVLLVAPIFVILFIFIKNARKLLAVSAAAVMAAVMLLTGPIFALADVESPGDRPIEILGLPITIISNVYMNDPESLSPECLEFMASLATEDEWAANHVTGSFNAVKFSSSLDPYTAVEKEGTGAVLGYMLEAVKARPDLSLEAVGALTSTVWGVEATNGWNIGNGISENEFGIAYNGNYTLNASAEAYISITNSTAAKYLFNFTGTVILFMLFAAVGNLGRGNLSRVFMVLSPLAYNFGTMLLLTGFDFRFFHFNFLIIVPLVYLFLIKKGDVVNENN